ncbi:hypothetical protein ACJRO7_029868 [Eucalyptus globulus]|uniref:F-box domain-containing protein n=1 Tax=Eucalyptus globulus TaxID=34317 RepID=A0ABD3JBS9_EUCGL
MPARNWADLPPELLELCSRRLCPVDQWAFQAVRRSCQSAYLEERSNVPRLMLVDGAERLQRKVFCLPDQRGHGVPVPEAEVTIRFSSRGR